MQQLKCPSCTTFNQAGETVCRECGASLIATSVVAPVAAVVPVAQIAPAAPIVEPAPVMMVDRGMSDQAKVLTALFAVVGLVLVGVAFYAWSESNRSQDQLERARSERSDRPAPIGAPVTAPAVLPTVIVTTPAPTVATTGVAPEVVTANHQEVATYVSTAEPLLREWRDGVTFVESAEVVQIAQTVSTLRDLEGRIANLTPPAAAVGVHGRLLTSMRNILIEITSAAAGRTAIANSEGYVAARRAFDEAVLECTTLRSAVS
jgi:hypothetical protein